MNNRKQLLGIIGSIVLFLGVFMPVVRVPLMGDMNYFQNGEGDGVIIVVLSGLSLLLVLANRYRGLWFTGIGSLLVLFFTFANFQREMSQARAEIESELAGNPFRILADMAVDSVQLQWGWPVMFLGGILIVASAATKTGTEVAASDSLTIRTPDA